MSLSRLIIRLWFLKIESFILIWFWFCLFSLTQEYSIVAIGLVKVQLEKSGLKRSEGPLHVHCTWATIKLLICLWFLNIWDFLIRLWILILILLRQLCLNWNDMEWYEELTAASLLEGNYEVLSCSGAGKWWVWTRAAPP